MNSTFNKGSDTDFNTAVNMSGGKYSYDELIGFILSGSIVEKQLAVLELDKIKSVEDAKVLVSNLVNQDGKVREVVALKINELVKNADFREYFLDRDNYEIFLKGIIDVNANNCRNIIEAVCMLGEDKDFCDFLVIEVPKQIGLIFKKLEGFKFDDKKHVINKTIFKLYWYLETLYYFVEKVDFQSVKEILLKSGGFYDYTIREKAAKILIKGFFDEDIELSELKNNLQNDENYYVRRLLG